MNWSDVGFVVACIIGGGLLVLIGEVVEGFFMERVGRAQKKRQLERWLLEAKAEREARIASLVTASSDPKDGGE